MHAIYGLMHMCIALMSVHMPVRMSVHMSVQVPMHMSMHMSLHVYIHCTHVCTNVYTHVYTHFCAHFHATFDFTILVFRARARTSVAGVWSVRPHVRLELPNWRRPRQRHRLSRLFRHRFLKYTGVLCSWVVPQSTVVLRSGFAC